MYDYYDKLSELIRTNSKFVVATVVDAKDSTPREIGAKMTVLPNGTIYGTIGGGKLERLVIQDAKKAMENGSSILKEYSLLEEDLGGIGSRCGGEAAIFIEVITRGERLLILGGGHIGRALYKIAPEAGFSVVVVDERGEFASQERFPKAELVLNCKVDDRRVLDVVDNDTYIVVMTHEHKEDKQAVKCLLDCDYKYLGMIGSARKVSETLKELRSEGVPKDKLDKIYTPIGLDIKAETPAEIAISILAELVQVRKTGKPSEISLSKIGR